MILSIIAFRFPGLPGAVSLSFRALLWAVITGGAGAVCGRPGGRGALLAPTDGGCIRCYGLCDGDNAATEKGGATVTIIMLVAVAVFVIALDLTIGG